MAHGPASWGAAVVVVLQILLPLALAWPAWRVEDPRKDGSDAEAGGRRRRGRRRRRHDASGAAGPVAAKAALSCTTCRAPVPLLAASFPCPWCGAPTTPPAEYVGAITAARAADADLERAERVWRSSRIWSAPPLLWTGRVVVVAWLGVVLQATATLWEAWPVGLLALAGLVAIVQVFFGLAVFSALGSMREVMPPLPPRAAMKAPAEVATCLGCSSPLAFPADRLSSVCGYCTAVQYRLALAHAAHTDARTAETAAKRSLLDGMQALAAKRFELAGAVALTGIAVLFYAVVLVIALVGRGIS